MEAEAVEGLLTATNLLISRPGEATGKIWESSGKCELFEFAYAARHSGTDVTMTVVHNLVLREIEIHKYVGSRANSMSM